ncbi:MAG: enolase C-terminal domain-like protein, partial [Pseudomonadota bacterium]
LKMKLGGDGADLARIAAVADAVPAARLIVDANEALDIGGLEELVARFADGPIALIEQPLPASEDGPLIGFDSVIPLCADESAHDRESLERIVGRYQIINIKLDKTGGLTEALALKTDAERAGLKIMVGCMVSTSLAMAPAAVLAQGAQFVDLDGPLLLAEDRDPPIRYDGATMHPPDPQLWG